MVDYFKTVQRIVIIFINTKRNFCQLSWNWEQMLVEETHFYDWVWIYNLWLRAYVLKYLNGRCIAVPLEKVFIKVLFGEIIKQSYHSFFTKPFFYVSIIMDLYSTTDILKKKTNKYYRLWWYRYQIRILILKKIWGKLRGYVSNDYRYLSTDFDRNIRILRVIFWKKM